jgi:hypothetical protein
MVNLDALDARDPKHPVAAIQPTTMTASHLHLPDFSTTVTIANYVKVPLSRR